MYSITVYYAILILYVLHFKWGQDFFLPDWGYFSFRISENGSHTSPVEPAKLNGFWGRSQSCTFCTHVIQWVGPTVVWTPLWCWTLSSLRSDSTSMFIQLSSSTFLAQPASLAPTNHRQCWKPCPPRERTLQKGLNKWIQQFLNLIALMF